MAFGLVPALNRSSEAEFAATASGSGLFGVIFAGGGSPQPARKTSASVVKERGTLRSVPPARSLGSDAVSCEPSERNDTRCRLTFDAEQGSIGHLAPRFVGDALRCDEDDRAS